MRAATLCRFRSNPGGPVAQRRIWRIIQFTAGALVVGLAVRSIVDNWQNLRAQPLDWRLSPQWLVLSIALVFAGYAALIEAWRQVVLSMGEKLSFRSAARIWFLASLGKYVPGKVWAIAGAAVLAQRAGVDASVAVAGALVLQALAIGSGAVIVAFTARDVFQSAGPAMVPLAALIVGLCLAGIAVLASQPLLDRLSRMLPASLPRLRAVRPAILTASFVANLLAWTAYGGALVLLAKGVLPEIRLGVLQAVGVFTCSYLVGFIALFAPGGLGPRESVFLLMLAGDIGLKPAAGLALASRLLLTGTEVLPAVPFLLSRKPASPPPSVREA